MTVQFERAVYWKHQRAPIKHHPETIRMVYAMSMDAFNGKLRQMKVMPVGVLSIVQGANKEVDIP